jgi:hypothetical protein
VSAGVQKETILQGVISEDFRPEIERRSWGLGNRPELAPGMMDDLQVVGGIHGVNQPFIELAEDLLEKQVGEAFGDLLFL